MASEGSLGEVFSRVAERVTRLLVQHVQLMRSELEAEARAVGARGRTLGKAIARAAPFLIAGVVLISFAAAQSLGLLLEPWLGRASSPAMLLLVGAVELIVAARWLQSVVARLEAEARPPTQPQEQPRPLNGGAGERSQDMLAAPAVAMERPDGSVG